MLMLDPLDYHIYPSLFAQETIFFSNKKLHFCCAWELLLWRMLVFKVVFDESILSSAIVSCPYLFTLNRVFKKNILKTYPKK